MFTSESKRQAFPNAVRSLSAALAGEGNTADDFERRIYSTLPHLTTSSSSSSTGFSSSSPSPSQSVAQLIDHTVLKADASLADIQTLCREAHIHHFYSVCVNPYYVHTALQYLNELSAPQPSSVKVAAVCGFPLGANTAAVKAEEARELKELKADEVDVVVNVAALQARDAKYVLDELTRVVQACQPLPVKVILESALLTDEQVVDGCLLSALAGAAFVKTSTGFNAAGGARVATVSLMRAVVGDRLGVKASGGIRDYATARAMVESGASRLGTSASVNITAGDKQGDKQQQQSGDKGSSAY